MSGIYLEACVKKGIKPLNEVKSALEMKNKEIKVTTRTQIVFFT